jgi:hypothetical protein
MNPKIVIEAPKACELTVLRVIPFLKSEKAKGKSEKLNQILIGILATG